MKRKAWFRPKRFGLGWFPISWEGWLMTMVLLFVIVTSALHVKALGGSEGEKLLGLAIIIIPAVIVFCVIAYLRTDKGQ